MPKKEARGWKYAFDPDHDVEHPVERPREDLSAAQKSWLKRAWENFSQAYLGFDHVPNAVPIYNEDEGFAQRPAIEPHWHHIQPVGVANRVTGEDYNHPRNIVPVEARNHVGKGIRTQEELDEEFVLHEDTWRATRDYSRWANGEIKENPYATMGKERRIATKQGKIYHDDSYDDHLYDLAERVTTLYQAEHPEDKWPTTKKEKEKYKYYWNGSEWVET